MHIPTRQASCFSQAGWAGVQVGMASRSRGDEMQDDGWRQTAHNESISNSNDYASMQYHQQQSQQLGIQQQYGTRPAYSSREFEHAQRPQHNQQQHPRTRYDSTLPDDYSKEHIDMQEVSHYPPSQQYLGPHPAQDYSASGARSQPAPAFSNAPQRGIAARSGSGPAYAPAPVATASMADLRDSISNSTTNSDGSPAKKPKRVYNTAFGPFSWSDLGKRKYWKYYAGLAILSILVLLAVIFHDDIITWMKPVAEKIRDLPGGWAIFV